MAECEPAIISVENSEPLIVLPSESSSIVVPAPETLVVIPDQAEAGNIIALEETSQVISMPGGIAGPPGKIGDIYTGTAAEAIGGHRVVYEAPDGLRYASASDIATGGAALGVTEGSATQGGTLLVRTHGSISLSGWAWQPSKPVWLGENGLLTQAPALTGVLMEIGVATNATTVFVRPQLAIFRS